MALSEVQAALARLFTDEAARADFLRDPQAPAARWPSMKATPKRSRISRRALCASSPAA
jgi:hypothetical protein